LLRGQLDIEHIDYLQILKEINCAILTAILNTKNQPTKSSLDKPSLDKPSLDKPSLEMPAIPPPQTHGAKQLTSEDPLSRKQSCHMKA